VKIDPVDHEIICLKECILKNNKKEIKAGKTYCLVSGHPTCRVGTFANYSDKY